MQGVFVAIGPLVHSPWEGPGECLHVTVLHGTLCGAQSRVFSGTHVVFLACDHRFTRLQVLEIGAEKVTVVGLLPAAHMPSLRQLRLLDCSRHIPGATTKVRRDRPL